jgi:hypothetical protein
MARKTRKSTEINPATGLPPRLRAPREIRVVSASDGCIPSIRLSGSWLDRIGFSVGSKFLVLPDVSGVVVLAVLKR